MRTCDMYLYINCLGQQSLLCLAQLLLVLLLIVGRQRSTAKATAFVLSCEVHTHV